MIVSGKDVNLHTNSVLIVLFKVAQQCVQNPLLPLHRRTDGGASGGGGSAASTGYVKQSIIRIAYLADDRNNMLQNQTKCGCLDSQKKNNINITVSSER